MQHRSSEIQWIRINFTERSSITFFFSWTVLLRSLCHKGLHHSQMLSAALRCPVQNIPSMKVEFLLSKRQTSFKMEYGGTVSFLCIYKCFLSSRYAWEYLIVCLAQHWRKLLPSSPSSLLCGLSNRQLPPIAWQSRPPAAPGTQLWFEAGCWKWRWHLCLPCLSPGRWLRTETHSGTRTFLFPLLPA